MVFSFPRACKVSSSRQLEYSRRQLPRSSERPHEEVLEDDEELDYSQIRDYEETIPRGGRSADHHLDEVRQLGRALHRLRLYLERNYNTGHSVGGRAGGLTSHPLAEDPQVGPGVQPPRGPNSADDPDDVDEELIEIDIDRYGL